MLKSMRLMGTIVSCSLSMALFADNVRAASQHAPDASKNKAIVEAIHSQMAGIPTVEPISAEKVQEVIDVAKKQFKFYNKKSARDGREYGGIIYERNGVVQATETVVGKKCKTSCGLNLDAQYNQLLHQAKKEKIIIYADWHTHGEMSETFSKTDREGMMATMDILHKRGHQFIGCFYSKASGEYLLVTFDKNEHSMRRAFVQHDIGNDKDKDVNQVASVEHDALSL